MNIQLRKWFEDEILEAGAAITRAAEVLKDLLDRGEELKAEVAKILERENPDRNAGDSSEDLWAAHEIARLRRNISDLEGFRQKADDLGDQTISLVEGLSKPGGWLHIQFDTGAILEDQELMEAVKALRKRYAEEAAGARYDAVLNRTSMIARAVENYQKSFAEEVKDIEVKFKED